MHRLSFDHFYIFLFAIEEKLYKEEINTIKV